MMKKLNKLISYCLLLIFLLVFLFIYRFIQVKLHLILIYFLIPMGLLAAYSIPYGLILTNLTGLILLYAPNSQSNLIETSTLTLIFVCLSVLPFYSKKLLIKDKMSFESRKNNLISEYENAKLQLESIEKDSKILQDEVERITRLYLLGRELVEQMEMKEIIDHLKISIFDRAEIKYVAIFSIDKQDIMPIYVSNSQELPRWTNFVSENKKDLLSANNPKKLDSDLLPGNDIVLWPVKIEESFTVAAFFAISKEFLDTCIEEGKIFIPQISLSFKRIKLFEEIMEKSRRDGLTGLHLRRYFIERLEGEIQRAKRYSSAFSLLMIDIDYFKNINDAYGHLVGDSTLKTLSQILTDSLRPGDLIGRYGGEEFVVLLPLTTIEEAVKIAERLLKIISNKDFTGNYKQFNLTVSIGISHYPNDGTTSKQLIEASDKALYWVKTHGRNGVKEFKFI